MRLSLVNGMSLSVLTAQPRLWLLLVDDDDTFLLDDDGSLLATEQI